MALSLLVTDTVGCSHGSGYMDPSLQPNWEPAGCLEKQMEQSETLQKPTSALTETGDK